MPLFPPARKSALPPYPGAAGFVRRGQGHSLYGMALMARTTDNPNGTSKLASYSKYPRDYLADTQDLSLEEHGAYNLLLDYQWLHSQLPPTNSALAMVWKVSPQKARALWARLAEYFPSDTGTPLNRRMERERASALARIDRAATGGFAKAHYAQVAKHAPSRIQAEPKQTPSSHQAPASTVLDVCSTPASVSVSVSRAVLTTETAGVPSVKLPSEALAPRHGATATQTTPQHISGTLAGVLAGAQHNRQALSAATAQRADRGDRP